MEAVISTTLGILGYAFIIFLIIGTIATIFVLLGYGITSVTAEEEHH